MKYSSKSWHYIEKVCNAMHVDPEEMYQKGREFLRYYHQTCCVPSYAMVAESDGSALFNRKVFLDEMEAACGADLQEMMHLLEDGHVSPAQMKDLVSETVMRLYDVGTYGDVYREIVTRKYLAMFPMTDTAICELMTISNALFYFRHKEACAYFMLTLTNAVLPRLRAELTVAEETERLLPREALYG